MLTSANLQEISRRFSIYDHEWRVYASVLGEPFLIDGYLVYFDGVLVSICAYRLGNTDQELTESTLTAILSACPDFAAARAVCVWGPLHNFETLSLAQSGGELRSLPRVLFRDYDTTDVESLVDVAAFDYDRERPAREMHRRVQRSDLLVETVQRPQLLAEHLGLIEEWSTSHHVSPYHATLAAAVAAYVADPAVHLVESRLEDRLVGFGVISVPSVSRIAFLQNFNMRQSGMPIGDSIYAEVLAFARVRGAEYVHMGYSATPSLRAFKRKWAARLDQPPYREAFFTDDAHLTAPLKMGNYAWQARLLSRANLPFAG
jgi:hypothetical protein